MPDPRPKRAPLPAPREAGNHPRQSARRGPRIGSPGPGDDAPPGPDAVLLDAGNLGPVARVLGESRVRFEHVHVDDPREARWPHPRRLLVMSAQLALRLPLPTLHPDDRVTAIALAEDGAETLTTDLARLGFRYRVGPGVHVEALRLLVEQALFRGHEQRQSPRLPLGARVRWRQGLQRRHGTLVEASEEGARLHAPFPLAAGKRLTLQLLAPLEAAEPRSLPARTLRVERTRSREPGLPHVIALRWEIRSPSEQAVLDALLRACRGGPVAYARPAPGVSSGRVDAAAEAERRNRPRIPYPREVVTLDSEQRVQQALLGQDLSRSGMRVSADSRLRVGQRVRIALYASAGADALQLDAAVARDDGVRGLALRFLDVSPSLDARLRDFIQRLPSIHALQPRPERVVMGQLIGGS